jgi:hypothetical protein
MRTGTLRAAVKHANKKLTGVWKPTHLRAS